MAGELLMVTVKRGGDQSNRVLPCLPDLGVTKIESSRWQSLASIPEDDFHEAIERQRHCRHQGQRIILEQRARGWPAPASPF